MRVDVYPTHRTVAVPQRVLDNTAKNATGAKTVDGGVALENVLAGYPFPIPKTGSEAIWNHLLRYNGLGYDNSALRKLERRRGRRADARGGGRCELGVADLRPEEDGADQRHRSLLVRTSCSTSDRPAATAKRCCSIDAVNPLKQPRRAWQYLPGQRRVQARARSRVRHAESRRGRRGTYDDVSVFNGAIDRYDWKLVGKKEMYVPYSSYRLTYHKTAADITKPNHLNPDFVRWELHRVWVVEATLKPDKRHIYSKRVFYLDEDSWTALASDQYDARGQLYRSSFAFPSYSYDVQAPFGDTFAIYDFSSGVYNITGLFGPYNGSEVHDRVAEGQLLVVRGARRRGSALTGLLINITRHTRRGARTASRRAGRISTLES